MNGILHDRVLHISYHAPSDLPAALLRLADEYEGPIPHRIGWNLPVTSTVLPTLTALFPTLLTCTTPPLYLIVYPVRDIQTKKHELLHARYAMDPVYRCQVRALWTSLTRKEQEKVLHVLRTLQYPDREELLLDEFQAYYLTEPPRFFGISLHPLPSSASLPSLPSLLSPASPSKKRRK